MSNWIQLAGPNGYDFETDTIFGDFEAERDIALPLAGTARYVRHTDRPWPVAPHSLCVAATIYQVTRNKEAAFAGLMHDVHEAVIGDIPTPVAWELGYEKVKALKLRVHAAIFLRLGIDERYMPDGPYKAAIDAADQAALTVEKQLMMAPPPRSWNVPTPPFEYVVAMHEQVKLQLAGPCTEENWVSEFMRVYWDLEPINYPTPGTR